MNAPLVIQPTGKKKRLNIKILNEKRIEKALNDSIDSFVTKINAPKAKSTLTAKEINVQYEPTIDWGKYDVPAIVEKMALFSEKLSGVPLYEYQKQFQKRVFESVLLNDGAELTSLWSRQSGKSECIAQTIDTLMILMPVLAKIFPAQLKMYKNGFHVGLFAPINEQAYTTHTRMDLRLSSENADVILSDEDIEGQKKYSGGTLSVTGRLKKMPSGKIVPEYFSFCKMHSAAKQAKIESKTYHLIIIEEAQEVDSLKVQKSILPMCAATNGSVVKIGTPIPVASDFYHATLRNKRHDAKSKTKNHFEYDYHTAQKYNPFYKAYVRKQIELYGADSDAFRMAFGLEWLLEKGMALTQQQFDEYMKYPSGKYEYHSDGYSQYIGGLDLASKSDSTVLTIAKIEHELNPADFMENDEITREYATVKTVVNWLEMAGENWEFIFHTVLEHVLAFELKILTCDASGVGDPIVQRLELALQDSGCTVIPVVANLALNHEMAVLFYDELRKHRILIPAHQSVRKSRRYRNFTSQFFSCEKSYNKSYMSLHHSEDPGEKDDYVKSLLLLLYGAEKNILPIVKTEGNIFYSKSSLAHSKRWQQAMERARGRATANWRRAFR